MSNYSFLSYEEAENDNTLIGNGIGIVSINMENPLLSIANRTRTQGASNTKSEVENSAYDEKDFQARPTILAYAESYESALLEIEKIPTNCFNLENPNFKKYTQNWAFKILVKLTLETALRVGKGGEITAKVINQKYPGSDNPDIEEIVKIYAKYHGDGNSVSVLYSNGNQYAFVSKRVILAPVKGINESNNILYDWDWSKLTNTEKKQYISWLNQIISPGASTFLCNLVKAIKIFLGIDLDEPSDNSVKLKVISKENIASGLEEVEGVFAKINIGYDLSKVEMTEDIGCVPYIESIREISDLNTTADSQLEKATLLNFEVSSRNEMTMEKYECLIPLSKVGVEELKSQGFSIIGGEVKVQDSALHIKLLLKHNITNTNASIEHLYKKNHIKIIQDFPHIVAKTWLSGMNNGGKIQGDIYTYKKNYNYNCDPALKGCELINHDKEILIICDDNEFSKIPEVYYTSSERKAEENPNIYYQYCLATIPDILSFKYIDANQNIEVGCLMTQYQPMISNINKKVVIGVDMGTCNSLVAVREDNYSPQLVDIVNPIWFHSITNIPKAAKVKIEEFYRLCLGYDTIKKKKIRTAVRMYVPEGEIRSLIHKNGALFIFNSQNMNLLNKNMEEKGLDKRAFSYVETNIKFGGEQRSVIMHTFLREFMYPVIVEQIAKGATKIEIHVSYPNKSLENIINTTWSSLVKEMRTWPMVKNKGITIQNHQLWTEACAVANNTLHKPGVIAATHIGFCNIDIGDGTTDISCFTPSSDEKKFEFKDQLSLKYAADDIIVDSIVNMYADNKNNLVRYKEIYGQSEDTEFSQIWYDNGSEEYKQNIERASKILAIVDERNEIYRDIKEYESLRNELVTLIEEYGIDSTKLSDKTKALFLLRYSTLFYTVACYLKEVLGNNKVDGIFPVYLYGGGAKGLNLFIDSGRTLSNSAVGVFFRKMIANKIGCEVEYIELEMKSSSEKNEVALGLVQTLHSELSQCTIKSEQKVDQVDLSDDSMWKEGETDKTIVEDKDISGSLYKEIYTVRQEIEEIRDKIMGDYIKTLFVANRGIDVNSSLLNQSSEGWLYTILQSIQINKNVEPKDSSDHCYVSAEENIRIMSALDVQRNRVYGNTEELPQKIRLCYQAARMVDQYLIKVSTESYQQD